VNASTSPIAVPSLAILEGFAEMLIEIISEAEQAGQSTGMFKLTAKLTALIIQHRGVEDAARFVAKISGLDVVDGPSTLIPAGGAR